MEGPNGGVDHVGEVQHAGPWHSTQPDAMALAELPRFLQQMVFDRKIDQDVANAIAKGYEDEQASMIATFQDATASPTPHVAPHPTPAEHNQQNKLCFALSTPELGGITDDGGQPLEGTPTVTLSLEAPWSTLVQDHDGWEIVNPNLSASSHTSGDFLMNFTFSKGFETTNHTDGLKPRKRKRQRKVEKAQNLPLDKVVDIKKHLTLSELIQFFRTNGMCPDPIFKNDVVAHVRGLDRDGFVAFVKQVNATVDAFATPFGYEGDVSASLNRIPVKTRSHAKMTATLLESKLRGRAAFQELQDGGSIKMYETTTPLLRWIVEEFVWFLHEFSIDNCKASDEYVQFARDFYLPDLADGITDLFTMLRLECGIGPSIGSVGTLADGAGAVAGPAATAAEPDQVTVESAANVDRAASAAMEMDPAPNVSHGEVYDLHFYCADFVGVIPKVTMELDSLNRTSGVELVKTQRPLFSRETMRVGGRELARWIFRLLKVTEQECGLFIPTGRDLSKSTKVLGKGHLVLIVEKNHELPDDCNGEGDSGPHDGDGDAADSPDPMEEDPPPPAQGGEGGGGSTSSSQFGSGHGFDAGGNKRSHNPSHTNPRNDPTETSSDCSEGQLPGFASAAPLTRVEPVLNFNGAFARLVVQRRRLNARRLPEISRSPIHIRDLEARRLGLLAFSQRDAGLSFTLLSPLSVPKKLVCLNRPGQPIIISTTQSETWKRQLVSAASFLQPETRFFLCSEFLLVGNPPRLLIAAERFEVVSTLELEVAPSPTIAQPQQHVWATTFDVAMCGMANNTVTHAALTSVTPEQVGLVTADTSAAADILLASVDGGGGANDPIQQMMAAAFEADRARMHRQLCAVQMAAESQRMKKELSRTAKARTDGTNLVEAAQAGDLIAVEAELCKGVHVDCPAKGLNAGATALYRASEFGRERVVQHLLRQNANPNLASKNGETSLQAAVSGRTSKYSHNTVSHVNVMKMLIEAGADLNTRSGILGATPLHTAVTHNRTGAVEVLVAAGADISAKNQFGKPAIDPVLLEPGGEMSLLKLAVQAGLRARNPNREDRVDMMRALAVRTAAIPTQADSSGPQMLSEVNTGARKGVPTAEVLGKSAATSPDSVDVLISYATRLGPADDDEQGLDVMLKISETLKANNIEVYHGKMCPPGLDWKSEWFGRVKSCKAAIVMLSPAYFQSKQCVQELGKLVRNNNLGHKIIPIVVGSGVGEALKADFCGSSEVEKREANATRTLLTGNWLPPLERGTFQDAFDAHVEKLVSVVKAMLG